MNDDKDRTTFADKLTLDEIAENDLNMVKDAIKNANKYHFGHDMKKAVAFIRECLGKTLVRLGVSHPAPPGNTRSPEALARHAAKIDREMNERQIRIEHRNQYKGNDMWRCGLYVYQRDELVTFISDVLTQRRTEVDPISMKIGKETQGFLVITNARLEDTKRIFLMPTKKLISGVNPLN
jgi:hypothetical protein